MNLIDNKIFPKYGHSSDLSLRGYVSLFYKLNKELYKPTRMGIKVVTVAIASRIED